MIFILLRMAILIGLVGGVCYVVLKLLQPSGYSRCSRCDGKGFWYDARGKEICNWCKGTGKLPGSKGK